MTQQFEKTNRGFAYGEFSDAYGVECSLQESSAAGEEGYVWFGSNDIGLKKFVPGDGWSDIELENTPNGIHHSSNTRMHLSQSMVKELLPALQYFAETGQLPG